MGYWIKWTTILVWDVSSRRGFNSVNYAILMEEIINKDFYLEMYSRGLYGIMLCIKI